MRLKLSLPAIALALAFPIAALSVEGTAYLAPRDRTPGEAVFEQAPPDTGTPVDWRGGVPGADAADGQALPTQHLATREALARDC